MIGIRCSECEAPREWKSEIVRLNDLAAIASAECLELRHKNEVLKRQLECSVQILNLCGFVMPENVFVHIEHAIKEIERVGEE